MCAYVIEWNMKERKSGFYVVQSTECRLAFRHALSALKLSIIKLHLRIDVTWFISLVCLCVCVCSSCIFLPRWPYFGSHRGMHVLDLFLGVRNSWFFTNSTKLYMFNTNSISFDAFLLFQYYAIANAMLFSLKHNVISRLYSVQCQFICINSTFWHFSCKNLESGIDSIYMFGGFGVVVCVCVCVLGKMPNYYDQH